MHTNDELLACGTPTFGRNAQDRIESGNGWRSGGCSGVPNFQGTLIPDSSTIGMPATNASLATVAAAGGYTFTGPTTIKFGTAPGKITVTNLPTYNNTQMAYPSNGVIYVKASGSCPLYSALLSVVLVQGPAALPAATPPNVSGCGDALISGTYDTDLTIATQNDLIVTGDVNRDPGGDAMLGLIADGFVRVEHDTNGFSLSTPPNDPTCNNMATGDRRIDAAILTLLHSVTVDRYYCGNPIGKLTINGMIAQKFRGAVGKNSGGSVVHGFLKDYAYDPRLAFRSPPHFLDPVKSAWHVHRYTEQEPVGQIGRGPVVRRRTSVQRGGHGVKTPSGRVDHRGVISRLLRRPKGKPSARTGRKATDLGISRKPGCGTEANEEEPALKSSPRRT